MFEYTSFVGETMLGINIVQRDMVNVILRNCA